MSGKPMGALLDHIERSARSSGGDLLDAQRALIDCCRNGRLRTWFDYRLTLEYAAPLVLTVMTYILREQGFDVGAGPDHARGRLSARLSRDYDGSEGLLARLPRLQRALNLTLGVEISVADGAVLLRIDARLPTWADEFGARSRYLLDDTPAELLALVPWTAPAATGNTPPDASQRDPRATGPHRLGPGEELDGPIRGNLLDYSGFAVADELADLRAGVLPLGRYAFGERGRVAYGPDLFLGDYRTGAPMIYNGALICAPQNSGKTELMLRWAVAANRAGWSVFLIDVKGNLRRKLAGRLRGRELHFTTDPRDPDSDCLDLLSGLDPATPLGGMRVRQLAAAFLPEEGWEQGEQAYFHQNHVNWMSALLHLLLLYRHYCPEDLPGGRADLGHLYDMAADEQTLYRVIDNIAAAEARCGEADEPVIEPGGGYWVSEAALLIDPLRGGQRTGDYSYRTLTQSIVNTLRPFSRFGTLHAKTSGEGERFSFDQLGDPDQPVTMILAAREQDLDDATTVVSVAVEKLQQCLFDRMTLAAPRPVLLLLDETRRIRGFKANEYITFAREAKAGCVIVYQSLDQIGEPARITEILENIGTQVYLGSLVGNTAQYFIDTLPVRYRPSFSEQSAFGSDGISHSVQVGQEQIGFVTSNELYRLPAGEWPALVYINDQPRRAPFLVDLDTRLLQDDPE